ncbi:hypothetical protein chiPu_0032010, partial [Chiloscyllium punctatum]|nr:hypothetical protein [Chiloscyllium punctatum]
VICRSVDAGGERQHHGDQHRHDRERDGQHQPLRDQSGHRRAIDVAVAEVADRHALEPEQVAYGERLIEAELDGERAHRIGRGIGAHQHLGGIAGQRVEHQENDQRGRDQRRQQGQDPPQKEYAHARQQHVQGVAVPSRYRNGGSPLPWERSARSAG